MAEEDKNLDTEVVDNSRKEDHESAPDGSDKKSLPEVVNLKYPLDNLDYKGTLTFQIEQIRQEDIEKAEETLEEISNNTEPGRDVRKAEFTDEEISEAQQDLDIAKFELAEFEKFEITDQSNELYPTSQENITKKREEVKTLSEKVKKMKAGEEVLQPVTSISTEQNYIVPTQRKRVTLYMPMALNFRDNVGYENVELGFTGGIIEGAGKMGASTGNAGILGRILEGGGKTMTSLFGDQSGDLATLAALQVNVVAKSLGEGAVSAIRQVGGVRLNPNTRAIFKSVALREFAFQFKFIAKSLKEADQVEEIIQFFREELYPEHINIRLGDGDAGQNVSVGYRFPKRFIITPRYDNKPVARNILPCFLRDVTVVYNPTNQTMHGGDKPHFTEIDMSLSFTESRTLSRKDIQEGGY